MHFVEWSGRRASTSASQACGSMSLSLALAHPLSLFAGGLELPPLDRKRQADPIWRALGE